MSEKSFHKGPLIVTDFRDRLGRNLQVVNQALVSEYMQGNLTYAIKELEISMPVREKVIDGVVRQFVVLGKKAKPGDTLTTFRFRL